ncbi:hypothetical protein CL656_02130 [bacterium]|nr:hypothetical protein [bacterium]
MSIMKPGQMICQLHDKLQSGDYKLETVYDGNDINALNDIVNRENEQKRENTINAIIEEISTGNYNPKQINDIAIKHLIIKQGLIENGIILFSPITLNIHTSQKTFNIQINPQDIPSKKTRENQSFDGIHTYKVTGYYPKSIKTGSMSDIIGHKLKEAMETKNKEEIKAQLIKEFKKFAYNQNLQNLLFFKVIYSKYGNPEEMEFSINPEEIYPPKVDETRQGITRKILNIFKR